MSEYPLSHFLKTITFRKMIAFKMSDSAAGIKKSQERVTKSVADVNNIRLLENKSRPNLGKYSVY